MLKYLLLINFLLIFNNNVNSLEIPIVGDIQDIIGLASGIQDILAGNIPFKSYITKVSNPISEALEKLDGIKDQISALSGEINDRLDNLMSTLLEQLPLQQEISTSMREFHSNILRIDELYSEFESFIEAPNEFRKVTLDNFIDSVISNSLGDLPNVLTQIHGLFVPSRSAGITEQLLQLLVKAENLIPVEQQCAQSITLQDRIIEIFNLITVSELRGFVMTLFAYNTLATQQNASYVREVKKATAKYILRSEEYILTTQKQLSGSRRDVFRCDPPEQIRGETFVELEKSITGYLIQEQAAFSRDTCSNSCNDIDTMETYRCVKVQDRRNGIVKYCASQKCMGRAWACHSVQRTEACEYPAGSNKRYKWLNTALNGHYGQDSECDNGAVEKVVPSSPATFYYCDVCFCRCIETLANSTAIRTLNLVPQSSNIEENKVVTNVRFIEQNNMIHIMVEETPLLSLGRVDRNESGWLSPGTYEYKIEGKNGAWYSMSDDGEGLKMEWGVDYTFITDKQRKFNFDEIQLPSNYVLTGIRMNHAKPADINSPVWIELQGTPFDFNSGKLTPTEENPSKWFTPLTQPTPPKQYTSSRASTNLGDKLVPLESPKNLPMSKPCSQVEFSPSSVKKDAAQSTIPFFDAQPVGINRTLGIGGIETFWKSAPDHGGYIAMKIFGLDHSRYMSSTMKKDQLKQYKKLYRQKLAFDIPHK